MIGHAVLGDEHEPEPGHQLVDAMVDLRISVVGAAGYHHDGQVPLSGIGNVFLRRLAQIGMKGVIGSVGGLDGGGSLVLGDVEFLHKVSLCPLLEIVGAMEPKVGVEEPSVLELGQVGGDQVGVVGHHRTVVVVVADALVKVIAHAGVEDGIHTLLQQAQHMTVYQLSRIAHRV